MTAESILLVTNFLSLCAFGGLLAAHIWFIKQWNRENEKYMKAFMARDLNDYDRSKANEAAINRESSSVVMKEPDIIPIEEADDELFNRVINNYNNPGGISG